MGQSFVISLESIPSAGYTWKAEWDQAMVELVNQGIEPLKKNLAGNPIIGGSSIETFEFRAKKKGETKILLKYKREWESTPRNTRSFQIKIKE